MVSSTSTASSTDPNYADVPKISQLQVGSHLQKSQGMGIFDLASRFLWQFGGKGLDTIVSSASGLRAKHLSSGWGDLVPILEYADTMNLETLPPIPAITWHGEWTEVDGAPSTAKVVFSPFKLVLGAIGLLRSFVSGPEAPVKYPKLLIREGSFASPVANLLPEGSKEVRFRVVLPLTEESRNQPIDGINWNGKMAVHFAATGDEGFSIRQAWYAAPLAMQHGIGSIIPIQAFYGKRRPVGQKIVSSAYASVLQIVTMGCATIEEGSSIVRWLLASKAEGGLALTDKVCVTGVSLGGSMSACVSARSQADVAVAPVMATWSPSAVFKRNGGGVMSKNVDWTTLVGTTPTLPPAFQQGLPASVALTPSTDEEASDLVENILLNSCSLNNLNKPKRPDCAVCVVATDDLFIPAYASANTLERFGPECKKVEVAGGHATGFMVHHKVFRDAVVEALAKLEK